MRRIFFFLIAFWLGCFWAAPVLAQNDDRVVLSITPPLIKNNVSPGQLWKSYVKVVNNNASDMEAYVQVKDFQGGSETGTVEFISGSVEDKHLLSQWIDIGKEAINIPANKSVEIPFVVNVPEDASPGGHYAAVLVGNKPGDNEEGGATIKVSSMLASLILLSVDGDVEERGVIREFSTDRKVYFEPKVNFNVRFENMGNVHIQPQGEIRVYDWFGKDKGAMTINQKTDFGNVLPGGIRKWDFSWEKDGGIFEIGRYRAELILGYGSKGRQTINQTHYFWIMNLNLLAMVLIPLILFLTALFLIVKIYVRSAIRKTQEELGIVPEEKVKIEPVESKSRRFSFTPKQIALLAASLLVLLTMAIIFSLTKDDHKEPMQEKEQTELAPVVQKEEVKEEDKKDDSVQSSSTIEKLDKIKKEGDEETSSELASSTESERNNNIVVDILNGSGEAGAASLAADLIKEDYVIGRIDNADSYDYAVTRVRYRPGFAREAGLIKRMISDKAELAEQKDQEVDIVVVIGKDFR